MNSKKKILLVDDEIDILDFLSYNLIHSGYDVRTAINGEEGVEVAREFNPDLILLDMMMPEMDGVETCEKIRSITELRECYDCISYCERRRLQPNSGIRSWS